MYKDGARAERVKGKKESSYYYFASVSISAQ